MHDLKGLTLSKNRVSLVAALEPAAKALKIKQNTIIRLRIFARTVIRRSD
jgi:hypothetical protein